MPNLCIGTLIFWLSFNLGNINNLISTTYQLRGNDSAPQLGLEEASIAGMLYLSSYYQRKVTSNLGAAAYDWSRVEEADSVVQKVSRNEIAKTYMQLKKDNDARLDKSIGLYKKNQCIPASLFLDYFQVLYYNRALQQGLSSGPGAS